MNWSVCVSREAAVELIAAVTTESAGTTLDSLDRSAAAELIVDIAA